MLLLRPGTDAALALALMHAICAERRFDAAFVERHTVGFEALSGQCAPVHFSQWPPA